MREAVVIGWSLLLALLLLGPALGPGYVLSYDMVWVPDLAVRPDLLGVGSALPRAVPSDAVVAVLDEAIPGWLLQKLVLLLCVAGGGIGVARLLESAPTVARLVAVAVFQWNPYLVERLVLGHWPVLLGYAALPWLLVAAATWRDHGRMPWQLGPLVVLASLSASTGVVTALALLDAVAGRAPEARRRLAVSAVVLVAANAPWFVSGLLHAGSGTSDPAGARLFALTGEGPLPAPLAAVTLGGIWNGEVVPDSRDGILAWMSVALVVGLGGLGVRRVSEVLGRRTALGLAAMWVAGLGLALWTWIAPGSVATLAGQLPGGGLLRDGARQLALCVPGLACAVGLGAARLVEMPSLRDARHLVATGTVLLPVLLIPDAALGVSGSLDAVDYPESYARAAEVIADRASVGDVVVLPFTSYRQPSWNGDHKVLDPSGRYQPRDFVASDRLLVSGVKLAGEDPRVEEVAAALAASTPEERADRLARLGIGVVLIDRDAPGEAPVVAGTPLLSSAELEVVGLDDAEPRTVPASWIVAMVGAWALFLGALLSGVLAVRKGSRREK